MRVSERMPPAEPALVIPRRWWWRRRPPEHLTRFARGVWWAGHVQLPIALILLVVCLPLLIDGLVHPAPYDAAPGPGTFWMRVGEVWSPLLGSAMAGPFALSGLMLRATSGWRLYRPVPAGGGGPIVRVSGLAASVAGIAVASVLITVPIVYLLFHVVAAAFGLA